MAPYTRLRVFRQGYGPLSKRKVANPLALAVLAVLSERPMHPYEVAALLRERHKHESIKLNYGSLYTVVAALQREGLIVPHATGREGRRPERTVYALTEAGSVELFSWLRELLSTPVKEYTQFAAGLSLIARLSRDEAVALLRERAARLEEEVDAQRRALEALLAGAGGLPKLPRLLLLEGEHELTLRAAELAWVQRLVREIEDGTLPWPRFEVENGNTTWTFPATPPGGWKADFGGTGKE